MKKQYFIKLITNLLFGYFLLFSSCNKNVTPQDCDCNSIVTSTIPESSALTGKLFYKNSSTNNNFYNHKYWIVYVQPNCINCIHSLIVCNEDILAKFNNIPSLYNIGDIIGSPNDLESALDVKFAGNLKKICNPIFHPADYTYENIILTKIE